MQYFFAILMFLTSVFLILLVLVQRGRGGGLAGAFGGMGGQSAFGTKAGDLFTRITMIVAGFWILLCVASIAVLNSANDSAFGPASESSAFGEPGLDDAGGDEADGEATFGPLGGEDAGGQAPTDGGGSEGGAPSGEANEGGSSEE